MKKEKNSTQYNGPTVAPGMDDNEELNKKASENEINNGNFTEVTVLSNDEVDQSQ